MGGGGVSSSGGEEMAERDGGPIMGSLQHQLLPLSQNLSGGPCSSATNSCSNSARGAKLDTPDEFPAGMRVLVVDDDPSCLMVLERMLHQCNYRVTTCGKATDALSLLQGDINKFDLVISDVYMPDMDGFRLLELVGLEMDLPVIMMSRNGETSAVMKGIMHGACDFLLKPVRIEELRNIWQHVVRKKRQDVTIVSQTQSVEEGVASERQSAAEGAEHSSSANDANDGNWKKKKNSKRKGEFKVENEQEEVGQENDDPSTMKKPRVVWSVELHQQFVSAVNQLGIDKAVPKRILELMGVHGLTHENVARHLQKYQLYLKRLSGVSNQQSGMNAHFGGGDPFGMMPSDLGANMGNGQLTPQALAQFHLLGRMNPLNGMGFSGGLDPVLNQMFLQDLPLPPHLNGMLEGNGGLLSSLPAGLPHLEQLSKAHHLQRDSAMMTLGQESQEGRCTRIKSFKGKEDVPITGCLINQLPEQIMESIFNQLDNSDDRGAASQVCKMWLRMDGLTRKSLYIPNCYSIAPSDVSKHFKNLEKIKIKGKPRAYEFGLLVEDWGGHAGPWIEEIVRVYPKLQCLHLRRMDVTDEDLKLLASKCTKLQKLKLHKCSGFSTRGLEYITESCRLLRILDLEESDEIKDLGGPWLKLLQKGEGTLESLNIASAGLQDEENIKVSLHELAPRLKSMSSLKVSDMDLDSFFKILDYSIVPVVELGLGCYSSRRGEPKELAASFTHRLSRLRVLDLKFATMSAEIQIELLRHCYSLEELELRSAVGDRGMQVIGESCKQLKRIRVDHINSEDTTDYVTQKGMIAICEGCRELDFLVMYLSDVNNEALAAVGRCLPKLTDFRIVLLEVLEDVEGLPLDDGVRSLLQGCPLLTRFSVYLRAGGLTDKGVGYIGEFGAKLKWILLGCSGASDEGLRLMAEGCRELERLELRGCPFSEEQLASSILWKLKRLKYLWVQGIGATASLGAALVSNKPGFLVEFMGLTAQVLGYYTVTHPRTDHTDSVCLIYPKDKVKELDKVNSQAMHELTSQQMLELNSRMMHRDPCVDFYEDRFNAYVANYGGVEDVGFYSEFQEVGHYPEVNEDDHHLQDGEDVFYPEIEDNGMYFAVEDNGNCYDGGEDGAYIY